MENKRCRLSLWIIMAIIGTGIYVFSARPEPMSSSDEAGDMAQSAQPPAKAPSTPKQSPQDREALSPATGIAADAVRRMNKDAQK
jgi:hypothetical protein